jgi:hypothetical protein
MPPDTGGSPVSVASAAAAGRSAADDVTEVKVATAVGSRETDGFTTGFTILNTKAYFAINVSGCSRS